MKSVLDDEAVQKLPPGFKIALAEFARSGKAVAVPLSTLQLIEASAKKAQAAQQPPQDAVAADSIAAQETVALQPTEARDSTSNLPASIVMAGSL